MDVLTAIIARKRREVARRLEHALRCGPEQIPYDARLGPAPAERVYQALSRASGEPLKVIAEIKFASPSAGVIRQRLPGTVAEIARAYQQAGASAVSVLSDYPGFRGTPLDLRRAACAVTAPLLFKEFVVDPIQVRLARRVGASMVLLIVRALSRQELLRLVDSVHAHGLAPVVEAADALELERALETDARIIGVNARDLRTFRIDRAAAADLVAAIPPGRIAVYMSGISSRDEFDAVAASRADAALIGESLMRAPQPGARLIEYLK
jgi:indole-3-glycerol phosphate synthase